MDNQPLLDELKALNESVAVLRAEADIRRIMARYNMLCDVPLPELGLDLSGRINALLELFSDDATWEGVGTTLGGQFGTCVGRQQLIAHFERFFQTTEPKMILNVHYLTSEQIHVHGESADGQWVHFQPWLFDDGSAVIRSSRTNNDFQRIEGVWRMTHYRTENIFVAPLPNHWPTKLISETVLLNERRRPTLR